jgi:hypothetical protein
MNPPTSPPYAPDVYPVYYFSRKWTKSIVYLATNSHHAMDFACAWRDAGAGAAGGRPAAGGYLDPGRPLKAGEKANTYRGWSISWEYGSWEAISDNYDASWEGEEDGWVDNGERVWGNTLTDLIIEIDEYESNRASGPAPVGREMLTNWETAKQA